MLRGNAPAKLDDKGRLKIPSTFRGKIEEAFGREFFVTSLGRDSVRLYPLPVWEEIEKSNQGEGDLFDPDLERFLDVVNYYGQMASMDGQGRILIHPLVREFLGQDPELSVLGKGRWLEAWNRELLRSRISPITDEQLRAISRNRRI